MSNALEVAQYIISSIPVDNLKLQKLMFYSQAVSLVNNGTVLYPESIEAWPYGPVIPQIDHAYKSNGFSIIENPTDDLKISIDDMSSIDLVLGYYGEMSGPQLINETHSESPWRDAYNNGSGTTIETDVILNYYKDVLIFDD